MYEILPSPVIGEEKAAGSHFQAMLLESGMANKSKTSENMGNNIAAFMEEVVRKQT